MFSKEELLKRIAIILTLPLVAACAPAKDDAQTSTLRVGVEVAAPVAFAADGCGNTLQSARIVLREIELDADSDDDADVDSDEAEGVELGPYLIDLAGADFNGMLQQAFIEAEVPVGIYDELEFEVHKLEGDDARDAQASSATALQQGRTGRASVHPSPPTIATSSR